MLDFVKFFALFTGTCGCVFVQIVEWISAWPLVKSSTILVLLTQDFSSSPSPNPPTAPNGLSTPLVLFQSPRSSNWIICSNSSCWRFSQFSALTFFFLGFPFSFTQGPGPPPRPLFGFRGFPLLYACLIATIYTASGLSGFGFWLLRHDVAGSVAACKIEMENVRKK